MDFKLFIFALFALQFICVIAARKAAQHLKTQEDYYLAGKGLGFFPLMMTFVATQVGGGLILGSTEEAYRFGWTVLLYPLGQCLGFVLLAAGIGRKMSQFGVSTVAQLFEVVYKSVSLKKVASVLSILSLFFIFVAQIIASKKFMASVGVDYNLVFVAFWGIVIMYTVMGGLQAVVATDIIQALFFIVVFAGCFVFALNANPSSWSSVVETGLSGEGIDLNAGRLCSWLLMPLLFMVIEQDMAQRCFAAKSGKVVSWAAGIAALCTFLICLVPVYFGIFGQMSRHHSVDRVECPHDRDPAEHHTCYRCVGWLCDFGGDHLDSRLLDQCYQLEPDPGFQLFEQVCEDVLVGDRRDSSGGDYCFLFVQ